MIISIIGLMGTGKSTVGKILAQKLNFEFIDADEFLESKYELSISEIFRQHGEDQFRSWESACLKEIITKDNLVLATGGGVIEKNENQEMLQANTVVVYLTASPDCILARVQKESHRPLLDVDKPLEIIQKKLDFRSPLFNKIANLKLDTEQLDPNKIANKIVSFLKTNDNFFSKK